MPENNMPAETAGKPTNTRNDAPRATMPNEVAFDSLSGNPIERNDANCQSDEQPFTPLLTTRDWNAEWKELQKMRRRYADDADALGQARRPRSAPRTRRTRTWSSFLELARILPRASRCSTWAAARARSGRAARSRRGTTVVAADFSAGMLGVLREELDARGVHVPSFPKQMSWEDDWRPPAASGRSAADVCVASRSIAVADLEEALLRLTDVARRRVCITLATGSSPRTDERVLAGHGACSSVLGRDYLYAFNILAARGMQGRSGLHTKANAVGHLRLAGRGLRGPGAAWWSDSAAFVPRAERDAALARLRPWLEGQLVENERAGLPDRKGVPERALRLRDPRTVTWAFLAWDK